MIKSKKVIVAGTRDFVDYEYLTEVMDEVIAGMMGKDGGNGTKAVEIVSGTARGADRLGERYGKERGYDVALFPADWDKNGRSAGYIRNWEMAQYANVCVIFWDGKSKGTKNMKDQAQKNGLDVHVIKY